MLRALAVIAFIPVLAVSILAQGGAITSEIRTAANDAFQKQDWETAVKAYEKIVAAEDKNPSARYRLGMSLLALKRNEDAIRNLEAAVSISPNSVFSLALARGYARAGNTAKMYEVLEGSLKVGGIAPESLIGESDFAVVKNEAKFIDLVKRSDLAVNPCRGKPESRQFDFWVGEWLPKNAQGLTVGTSSIQLILGSCVIFENWNTPVSGGKSFSNFSTADGKWHQTWVDDKGTLAYYTGGLVDGKMVLDSERVVNGKKTIARMTFSKLENGDVRQHGENSSDDGKTWTTSFDFTYVRKK